MNTTTTDAAVEELEQILEIEEAGYRLVSVRGECESLLLFNPQDLEQARLAIRLVGARPRRTLSPERLQKLLAAGQRSRYGRETMAQDCMPCGVRGVQPTRNRFHVAMPALQAGGHTQARAAGPG